MFDNPIHNLLVLIPALPLAAAVLTAALGPKLLRDKSHWPTIIALVAAFALSLTLLIKVQHEIAMAGPDGAVGWETTVDVWTWANVENAQPRPDGSSADFDIAITLRADALTSMMLAMVTFVASLVAIYASGYMHGDRGYWRFFSYVSLFVFSMTMLVSVSNFLLLYVFWEAVGVCSYLLVGFWYEKPEAVAAGKKAFLVNRIGDVGFALALFLIWTTYGTLNFHDTDVAGVLGQIRLASPEAMYVGGGVATAICLLLLIGACGKSAQFPLYVWLPDAMEGPTPVSALIHAATMVTAGVYMITRCTPLFVMSHEAQMTVACVGAFTALLAGLIALTQNDLKRVLAYSTVSQLGYMFLAVGTGSLIGIVAGMFHLFTHAFFKALLFLGAGSVMHAMGGIVDMRRFGGLRRLMPYTHWTFLLGGLALAGVWPFAGFWSKDSILHAVHLAGHHNALYMALFWIGKFAALLTAFYTFRAFFLTFYGEEEIPEEAGHHAHESPLSMTGPLCILAVCAVFVGIVFHEPLANFLAATPSLAFSTIVATGPAHEALGWYDISVGTGISLVGVAIAASLYLGLPAKKRAARLANAIRPLYQLSHGKFYVDQIYNLLFVWPGLALAHLSALIDRFLLDGLVNLCGRVPVAFGSGLRWLQTGLVHYYAMLMILGLLVLMGTMFW
jgi:NADH-quinone oxidoreductase subunit L